MSYNFIGVFITFIISLGVSELEFWPHRSSRNSRNNNQQLWRTIVKVYYDLLLWYILQIYKISLVILWHPILFNNDKGCQHLSHWKQNKTRTFTVCWKFRPLRKSFGHRKTLLENTADVKKNVHFLVAQHPTGKLA